MQTQQYIRSTISLPIDLHKRLKMEAINKRLGFSELILDKLTGKEEKKETIKETLAFFKRIRQSGPSFDGAEIIRRFRDSGKI